MEDIRDQKQLDYRPIGRLRPGRTLKWLLDGYNREAKTGHFWPDFLTRRGKYEDIIQHIGIRRCI